MRTLHFILIACSTLLLKHPATTQVKDTAFAKRLLDSSTIQTRAANYASALSYCETAIELYKTLLPPNSLSLASAYLKKGDILRRWGSIDEAISFYGEALRIFENQPMTNQYDLAQTLNGLGICYRRQGKLEKAIDYYDRALQLLKITLGKDHTRVAYLHNNIANAFDDLGNHRAAITRYQAALDILLKKEDKGPVAKTCINLAETLHSQTDYGSALKYYELGRKSLLEGEKSYFNRETMISLLSGIGREKIALGDTLSGFRFHQQAFDQLGIGSIGNPQLEEIRYPEPTVIGVQFLAEDYLNLFKRTQKLQYLQKAAHVYGLSTNLIQQLKSGYKGTISKEILLRENYGLFEGAIESHYLLWQHGGAGSHLEQAFVYSEKARNVLLQEAVQRTMATSFANIPAELTQKESALSEAISETEIKLHEEEGLNQTGGMANSLRNKLFELKQAHFQLMEQFEKQYPQYFRLKYANLTADKTLIQQQLLAGNTALLEYFVGNKAIYCFIITTDTFFVEKLNLDFPLYSTVYDLVESISQFDFDEKDRQHTARYAEAAHLLYLKLIQPFSNSLPERIILIPGGMLSYVPFDALLTKMPAHGNQHRFGTYAYLGNEHQISYAFSATFLLELKERKNEAASGNLLAVAPVFRGTPVKNAGRGSVSLAPLSYNVREANAIAKICNGDLLAGLKASAREFLSKAGQYKILHLSTHGRSNDQDGEFSFLAFSAPSDTAENELLFVKELFNLRLNAELVVLSACETGRGEWQEGEGIMGLSRGFCYAGARSIVTTLWQINDEKSASLMAYFYKNLREGQPKDIALYQAKLEYIGSSKDWAAHPYFWAGFVPIGNMDPIEFKGTGSLGQWWLGLGVAIITLIWWFVTRKKRLYKAA